MIIYQVDAFTDRPFAGNPAAVCILPAFPEDTWMQDVACEMNLSETAFLVRREDEGFDLRWFTPGGEVDLCGHATLASAHVLWETKTLPPDTKAVFYTLSGRLIADQQHGQIVMDFPAEPPEEKPVPEALLQAVGTPPVYAGRNRMDYLLQFATATEVQALDPDMYRLAKLEARGLIVTAPANENRYDFVSRFFAPAYGIPEDPVTGSAHCCLAPFWQQKLGKTKMVGYQASSRGGTVHVEVAGDRVLLGGQAITMMRAELLEGRC